MSESTEGASPKSPAELLTDWPENLSVHRNRSSDDWLLDHLTDEQMARCLAALSQHQAEQPQDVVERVAKILKRHFWESANGVSWTELAKDMIGALGDGSATVTPVSAESVQPITLANPGTLTTGNLTVSGGDPSETPDNNEIRALIRSNIVGLMSVARRDAITDDIFNTIRPYLRTTEPIVFATPELAEGDLAEVESDLAEYLEGFEKLSNRDCARWASKIMHSIIRPHLRPSEPVLVDLEAGAAAIADSYGFRRVLKTDDDLAAKAAKAFAET